MSTMTGAAPFDRRHRWILWLVGTALAAVSAGAVASCARTTHSSPTTFQDDAASANADGGLQGLFGSDGGLAIVPSEASAPLEAGPQEAGFTGPLPGPF